MQEVKGIEPETKRTEPRTWLITGCSSGFGRSLAEAVAEAGDNVVATARRPSDLDALVTAYPDSVAALALDVTDPAQVRTAVASGVERFGRIDVLVNNAGYGLLGAVEEVDDAEIRREFDTNVFGALDVTRAILPYMRDARRGHIVNISSMGGFVARPGVGIYNSSKFALEGFSESLAQEVGPLGIRVTIVEPGVFRTEFAGRSMIRAARVIPDYAETSGATRRWMEQPAGWQPGDPAKAARAIIAAVRANEPPLRLVLGADALERIQAKLASISRELEAWRPVSLDTAF